MAINASAVWRVRAGGVVQNGAGFDAAISGAGTDYTDQDAAQLTLTDFTTSGAGSTTLSSATGGFTSAMIGNAIRIASGTNFQTGYYFVTARADTNNVTLDRTPTSGGAGSGGQGKLGGAQPSLNQFANGGTGTAATITSPLAAGHTIYMRGAGTSDPSSADYTMTSGYWQFAAGNNTAGKINLIGYNGKPRIDCAGLFLYQLSGWVISLVKIVPTTTSLLAGNGVINAATGGVSLDTCIIDQNGLDGEALWGGVNAKNCWFKNTGSTSSGTSPCISVTTQYGASIVGNVIDGWRGGGILSKNNTVCTIVNNIIANIKASGTAGIEVAEATTLANHTTVWANTVYNCASDGIKISADYAVGTCLLMNNIVTNNAAYGINCSTGSTALNDRLSRGFMDYNNVWTNTTANYHNVSAGAHDVSLDPQYTNAGSGDFSVGTNMKAIGFPSTYPG